MLRGAAGVGARCRAGARVPPPAWDAALPCWLQRQQLPQLATAPLLSLWQRWHFQLVVKGLR